ncbi:MAG TPA: hypothetical protein VH988_17340 [Thermoanaerobaculia bacterium]|jgi:hypothetical protein|nr:hypothetical protein [Thermoanaerobaculia bacterium]
MSPQNEVPQQHLSRRHFLALGAVGVALPWAGGLAQAAQAAQAPAVEPLSVGFLEGSDQLSLHYDHMKWSIPKKMSAAEPDSLPVLPAAGLTLGDQKLAGGDIKLTIHGLYPAEPADCKGVEAIDLDVLFPAPDPAVPVPARYLAWSFRRKGSASPPVSFRVPLGLDGRLDIAMRTVCQLGAAPVQRRFQTSFTADWQQGRPKLQRGIYVLGVRPGIWDSALDLPGAKQKGQKADLCSVVVSVEPIAAE